MAFRPPVAVRRGWVAEAPKAVPPSTTSEALTSTAHASSVNTTHEASLEADHGVGCRLTRNDDGGWRATLSVPEDVNSMDDIVLDLGKQEMHTSFKGRSPAVLEFPKELHGAPADAWKVRFSRKKRELTLEISGFDAKVVEELGGNIDLASVTAPASSSLNDQKPASSSPNDEKVIHNTKPPKKNGYYYDSKAADACAVEAWTKPQETAPAKYDSWNTKNAPYGDDSQDFDKKVNGFASRVSNVSERHATELMTQFGNDIKAKKKKANAGMMFDQEGGPPKETEIDPEAVDAAGALMAHSFIAVKKSEKLSAIIDAGVSADCPDEMGCTLLEKACLWGHVEIAKMLLGKGASAKGLAGAPSTPLHRAAACNGNESQQLVQMLLKAGADKHRQDSSGRTAADIAQASGNSFSHQLLL
eukprot:gnl/MRDRNA2_/MRDRNA2_108243_c0_seq1.p1 gnl/MRDRNA2_/MRDRNA2_108243_c0~~gnl/MRDRNA2_/MRDRNA2_108243_c0_seq1.p1  ORF type:complete len:416 (-),score=110.97 gnl/MRDRNA2_/MRDRNA2_108243_c0_seq1:180-1427(-)